MGLFPIEQVGEAVRTTWQALFTVQFLHSGYENSNENFLHKGIKVVPYSATKQLFTDQRIRSLFFTNTLVCFIECVRVNPATAEPKIPFIPVTANLHLRFLIVSSSSFAANTYIVAAGSKQTYQFSNQVNNTGGGINFLTAPVENHSNANDYQIGTVVQNGGNLFTSLKTVDGAGGIGIGDVNFWKQLQAVEQVVNNADLKDNSVVRADPICLGVIDVFNTGFANNSYRLFDVSDQLFNPAPVFTIKFASRF